MAAKPIPMPKKNTQVTIDPDGKVSGRVQVNNGDVVKFNVSGYPKNPPGTNTCIVTITSANITWEAVPLVKGQNTIKVGNG
jgi:hypothetical protein